MDSSCYLPCYLACIAPDYGIASLPSLLTLAGSCKALFGRANALD